MLYHLSNVRDPEAVAGPLCELLGATTVKAPSPPFNEGALFVCCGDDRGTMISLEPWGVTYQPGPGQMTAMPHDDESPPYTGFHGLFMAAVSEPEVMRVAAEAGWPAGRVPNGRSTVMVREMMATGPVPA